MPNDQYQLGELLGRGGMGQVHVARHRSGRLVAIKRVRNTLASDPLVVDRLTDEARLLGAVSHPNVVRALDHGTGADGQPFLVMDRAHGTPLHQLIAQHGPLPHDRMVAIATQLFGGLAAIHDAKIVHADLKSHNVLVDDVNIVTIIDFGLARTVTRRTTSDGFVAGTPAYMAPEVIAGSPATVAGDIYAAGTILYEMLTGATPFSGHISTILTRQLSESVEPPSRRAPNRGISEALDRVVLRALDPNPTARFRSVADLASAFAAVYADDLATRPRMARGSALRLDRAGDAEAPPARRRELIPVTRRTATAPAALPPGRPLRPARTATPMPAAERRSDAVLALVADHRRDRDDAVIDAALAGAQRRIEARDLASAIESLEVTLASLVPALDGEAPSCAAAWRLETVLAALYDLTGKSERARRMALVAYRHALRTGCPLAEARAGTLVDRLVARPRRARAGTAPIR
jgi:hypothetical protein